MATNIIKLHNGLSGANNITYVPVTLASAVQYSYGSNQAMSVQEAIGTMASSVIASNNSISDITKSIKISYNSDYGIQLSNTAIGNSNIKLQGETGVVLAYESGVLKIKGQNSHAQHSDDQKLNATGTANASATSSTVNKIRLMHSDGSTVMGEVGIKGSAPSVGYATVVVSYSSTENMQITVAYTDTNTHAGSHNIYASQASGKSTYINLGGTDSAGTIGIRGTGKTTVTYTTGGDIVINSTDSDEKITAYARNASTKYYILGTTGTANQKPVYDSNVYLDQAAGKFYTQYAYTTTPNASDSSTRVPTTEWVKSQIGSLTGALKYKGTVGTGGTVTALPAAHEVGDVYIACSDGNYAGVDCQVGDMLIANSQSSATGTETDNSHWTVIPIEFTVSPEEATANIKYDGTSGSTNIATIDGHTISLTYSHSTVSTTRARANVSPTLQYTGSFTYSYITGITNGHITSIEDRTVTLPAQKLSIDNLTASPTAPAYIALSDGGSAGIKGSTPSGVGYATVYVSYGTARKNIEITVAYKDTDTHLSSKNIVGPTATSSANGANTTTNSIYLNHIESNSNTPTSSHNIIGAGGTTVSCDANGKITITGNHYADYTYITSSKTATRVTANTTNTNTYITNVENATVRDSLWITGYNGIVLGYTNNVGVKVGHSNSVTAQSSQALRKIAFDAQGHITAQTAVSSITPNSIGISYSVSSASCDDFVLFDGTWTDGGTFAKASAITI